LARSDPERPKFFLATRLVIHEQDKQIGRANLLLERRET